MSFDDALRLIEIGVALAVLQRAYEHLSLGDTRVHFVEAVLAMSLLMFPGAGEVVAALWAIGLWRLWSFQGPYNGGADKMVLLALTCLAAAHWTPFWWPGAGEVALAYLAVQLLLSYVVSGWVKLRNPDWVSGRALGEVFAMSAYPQAEHLRAWGTRPATMRWAARAVIAFELAIPLALTFAPALWAALALAVVFHTANAVMFGLNRFLWAWVAVFPALIWFQDRVFG
ncbi:MAG: HTTM domain-containing protein [Pseudomonadota bacterium]